MVWYHMGEMVPLGELILLHQKDDGQGYGTYHTIPYHNAAG